MNPLHQPKPNADECLYIASFYIADKDCRWNGDVFHDPFSAFNRYNVRLTKQLIWLSPELAIPIKSLVSCKMQERRGWLVTRRALEIIYRNPISQGLEAVYLCDIDFIGLYYDKALLYLLSQIEEVIAETIKTELEKSATPETEITEKKEMKPTGCEACQAHEAFYVSYMFSIGAVVFWYRSEEKRYLHCRRHILIHGSFTYLVTVLFGWLGVCIIAYPFVVYGQAMNFKPIVGNFAYILGIAPTAVLALLIAHFYGAF
jgi:hypothetical protein